MIDTLSGDQNASAKRQKIISFTHPDCDRKQGNTFHSHDDVTFITHPIVIQGRLRGLTQHSIVIKKKV